MGTRSHQSGRQTWAHGAARGQTEGREEEELILWLLSVGRS